MTDQDIAQALEGLIREDAKRSPAEQVRELIAAGVIDAQGRVLLGGQEKHNRNQTTEQPEGPGGAAPSRKVVGT